MENKDNTPAQKPGKQAEARVAVSVNDVDDLDIPSFLRREPNEAPVNKTPLTSSDKERITMSKFEDSKQGQADNKPAPQEAGSSTDEAKEANDEPVSGGDKPEEPKPKPTGKAAKAKKSAAPKPASAKPAKKGKATTKAEPAKGKEAAAPKGKKKRSKGDAPGTPEADRKFDDFGFRRTSNASKALALYMRPEGAFTFEVKAACSSPQLNILKKVESMGHTVTREKKPHPKKEGKMAMNYRVIPNKAKLRTV